MDPNAIIVAQITAIFKETNSPFPQRVIEELALIFQRGAEAMRLTLGPSSWERRLAAAGPYYMRRISDASRELDRGSFDPKGCTEMPYLMGLRDPEHGVTEPDHRLHACFSQENRGNDAFYQEQFFQSRENLGKSKKGRCQQSV